MTAARPARRTVAALAALAAAGFLGAPAARADHTSYEPGSAVAAWYQEYGFPGRYSNRPRFRDPYSWRYATHRHVRDCGSTTGTPWVVMRQYLAPPPPGPAWHRHAECWFLRRWPVAKAGATAIAGRACEGLERAAEECPLTKAALDAGAEPATLEERILRGLERFRRGKTEEAAQDFRKAAEADPKEARARYGILMCAFVSQRWERAAEALRSLAALGSLDAHDRLDTSDVFEDPARVTSILKGLEDHARWSFHDTDAQLVLGWALAATGRPEAARTPLKSVLRFRSDDPAAQRLLADLDAARTSGETGRR